MLNVPGSAKRVRFATDPSILFPRESTTPSRVRTKLLLLPPTPSPVSIVPLSFIDTSSSMVTFPAVPLRVRFRMGLVCAMMNGKDDVLFQLPELSLAKLLQLCVPAGKSARVRLYAPERE